MPKGPVNHEDVMDWLKDHTDATTIVIGVADEGTLFRYEYWISGGDTGHRSAERLAEAISAQARRRQKDLLEQEAARLGFELVEK